MHLKALPFAIILPLAAGSAAAAATSPAPASPIPPTSSTPFRCPTAKVEELAQAMPSVGARPILNVPTALPEGDEGSVTVAGPFGAGTDKSDPLFRVFVAQGVVPLTPDRTGIYLAPSSSPQLREVHPTAVDHDGTPVATGARPRNAYKLSFLAPELDDRGLLGLVRDRSVIIAVCRGDQLEEWAARPLPFASQRIAQLWAGLAILVVYVVTAVVVYLRRGKAATDSAVANKMYRMEVVKSWSLLRCLDPVAMTADIFDRGSLSKFQILFFVLIVAYGLAYLAIWKGELTDLSPTIVYLLGIPALGTLGSQLASTTRDRMSAENWAWLVSRSILPINDSGAGEPPRWSDLVMSDSELDLTKLQALVFSFIVGFGMWNSGPAAFAKFAVPSAVLSILGLSQLVFVGGRFTKPTTLADIDNLVTELRTREAALKKAIANGVDVDETGKPVSAVANPPANRPTTLAAAAALVPVAVSRYLDTAQEVQVLLEALTHRKVDPAPLNNPKL